MSRNRQGSLVAARLAAFGVGLAVAALDPSGAAAQLRDPPWGWDMWGPGWTLRDVWRGRGPQGDQRMTRHWTFMRDGFPAPYQGARNPMTGTPDTLRAGGALYAERCASCHDASGMGKGDAGNALYPSPALLAHLLRMPQAVDEYLLWAIAEGGQPFGTAMPAFKDALTREQIWQIITYMRAGFPRIDEAGRD